MSRILCKSDPNADTCECENVLEASDCPLWQRDRELSKTANVANVTCESCLHYLNASGIERVLQVEAKAGVQSFPTKLEDVEPECARFGHPADVCACRWEYMRLPLLALYVAKKKHDTAYVAAAADPPTVAKTEAWQTAYVEMVVAREKVDALVKAVGEAEEERERAARAVASEETRTSGDG